MGIVPLTNKRGYGEKMKTKGPIEYYVSLAETGTKDSIDKRLY